MFVVTLMNSLDYEYHSESGLAPVESRDFQFVKLNAILSHCLIVLD